MAKDSRLVKAIKKLEDQAGQELAFVVKVRVGPGETTRVWVQPEELKLVDRQIFLDLS